MPETKAHPDMPNRKTHGDAGDEPATTEGKPAATPTAQRQDSETVHHGQHEELPGKPVGGRPGPKG